MEGARRETGMGTREDISRVMGEGQRKRGTTGRDGNGRGEKLDTNN